MVLIRRIVTNIFLFLSAICMFAQGTDSSDYAISAIKHVLYESPEGIILINNIQNIDISFRQQKKVWIPDVQLDFSGGSEILQGDYNLIKNRGLLHGPQLIINPSIGISIAQALPGNGQLSMSAGYDLSYIAGQDAFKQKPYFQIGLAQTLSHGAFGITEDPSIRQLNNQLVLSKLENDKSRFDFISSFITTVQNYDLAKAEFEYYEIMLTKANSEYLEQSKRHQSGQYSNIDLFNSHMQLVQAKQSLQQSRQKLTEARTLLDIYECEGIFDKTELFRDGILFLLNIEYDNTQNQTVQEYELMYEIEDEKLSYNKDKMNLAPSLYLQTFLVPAQNQNSLYSDFSRSLRELLSSSSTWTLSTSFGIHIKLDLMLQGKALKEVSDKKIQNLNLQLDILREEENKIRGLYQDWSISFAEYCKDLDNSIKQEEDFRKDMKILFDRNLITEAQYWGTELSFHEIRLNYYRSIWNMIQGKMQILSLSSDWMNFLNHFLEVEK